MANKSTRTIKKPLISISIPLFNEEKNLPILYNRLTRLADKLEARYNLEFVFSDNHSDDNTWMILSQLAEQDSRVRALRLSKNFGFRRPARSTGTVRGVFKRMGEWLPRYLRG